jgi:cell division protein FtsQ
MARKNSPTISQEEMFTSSEDAVRPDLDDARMLDLDADEESPFLRAQKRVSVRRGALPKKAATRLKWVLLAVLILTVLGFGAGSLYSYGQHSWRFRIQSSDDISITGNHSVTRAQIMEVMGGDIGRNIFFIPLGQRKAQLEQIPWVESAAVMRFIPNQIQVEIRERTPVAFARIGSRIALIDGNGVVLDLSSKKKYSFPVILGMNSGEPLSTRAARMKIYNQVVRELDSGGARYSQDISEVDLSDPDDVKVVANDPQGAVLIHLGPSNFLDRYKVYVSHVQEWRQQFEKVDSVDLRYDRQIIVNPDLRGVGKQAPLSASAARVATAAGVKKAALLMRETPLTKPRPVLKTKAELRPAGQVRTPFDKLRAGSAPTRVKTGPTSGAKKKWSRRQAKRWARKAAGKNATIAHMSKPAGPNPASASAPVAKPVATTAPAIKKPSPAIAKEQGNQ